MINLSNKDLLYNLTELSGVNVVDDNCLLLMINIIVFILYFRGIIVDSSVARPASFIIG